MSTARFSPRVAALALRRTLLAAALPALAALLIQGPPGRAGPRGIELSRLVSDQGPARLADLGRLDLWSVFWLLSVPLFLWQVARQAPRSRTEESRWLATAPVPRLGLACSRAAGLGAAAVVLVVATALCAEWRRESGPGQRRERLLDAPPTLLEEGSAPLRWSVPAEALPAAARKEALRLRLTVGVAPGSGPAVDVSFALLDGGERRSTSARIGGRTQLELGLEPRTQGAGALELELARAGPGAALLLPRDALELLRPEPSRRATSWRLALRGLAFLLAASGLVLGLAARLRPGLATALVLAPALAAWNAGLESPWLPAGDLASAWLQASSGLVPVPAALGGLVSGLVGLGIGILWHARVLGNAQP